MLANRTNPNISGMKILWADHASAVPTSTGEIITGRNCARARRKIRPEVELDIGRSIFARYRASAQGGLVGGFLPFNPTAINNKPTMNASAPAAAQNDEPVMKLPGRTPIP